MQDIRVEPVYNKKRADKQCRHNGFRGEVGIVGVVFVGRVV